METRKLTEAEVNHARVLASLLQGYAEGDSRVFDLMQTTLSLVMAIEFKETRDLNAEQFRSQINLIEHFQKHLTKQVVTIF